MEKWDEILGEKVYVLFFPYVTGKVVQVERAKMIKAQFFGYDTPIDAADQYDFLTVNLDKPVKFEGAEPEDSLMLPRWIWRRTGQQKPSKLETCPFCDTPVPKPIIPPPNPYVPLEKTKDEDKIRERIAAIRGENLSDGWLSAK